MALEVDDEAIVWPGGSRLKVFLIFFPIQHCSRLKVFPIFLLFFQFNAKKKKFTFRGERRVPFSKLIFAFGAKGIHVQQSPLEIYETLMPLYSG